MLNTKSLLGFALAVSLLGLALPAEAAQGKKVDSSAARAECFRQANAAVEAAGPGAAIQGPEKQARGVDAYRQCCLKAGIKP